MAKSKALICPYCGETQPVAERCRACGGLFEPLSRQATHNEMGPWFIRDPNRPFHPGCSYETLIKLIERGQINKFTILRGPTTKQYWTIARRVPGVSHLLGFCHNCDASVDVGDHGCHACGVPFGAYLDRNYLGLPEIRPLPWEASHDEVGSRDEASSRMMDFRRAAEPLGISSFASDAELRGGTNALNASSFSSGGGFAPVPGGLTAETARPAHAFADPRMAVSSGFIAAQPEAIQSAQAISTARAMARQRRMVRLLTIGLVAMVIVAAGALVMLLVQAANRDKPQGITAPPAEPSIPTGESPNNSAKPDDAQPTKQEPAESVESKPPAIDVDAQLQQVQTQLSMAEDLSNSLEQRLAAYDEAVRLLKEIDVGASADQKPADLQIRIKAAERAAHDLRLNAYFP